MLTGRIVNTKRNIAFGFLQVCTSYLAPFIVRTVLLYRFSVIYLGLNSLFSSILSVLSLMEMGFGSAIVFSLYRPVAEGNQELVCAYLKYYRRIYRVIGFGVLIVGLALMPFLKSLIKDAAMPGNLNNYVCYFLFLSDTVISYLLFGFLTAIPIAYQRMDLLSRVEMLTSLLKCVIQCLILISTRNYYLFLISMPIITALRNIAIAWMVKRKYPELECKGEINGGQRHDLRRRVYGLFINKLTNTSRNGIDSLCISAFLGLAITGIYNNYYYIMSAILSLGIMICNSMQASVGNSIAVETREKNYSDMRLFDFIFMSVVSWASVCMLCLYKPFVLTWVGAEMSLGLPVVIGFSLYFYVLESGAIQWVYHQGAGLWYENRYVLAGETVANIIFNILLCRLWGVIGIVVATIISVFFTNCVFCPFLLFKKYFKNGKLVEYWLDHLLYGGTLLLMALICWAVCERVMPVSMVNTGINAGSIACLVGRLALCTVISISIHWILWHRSQRYIKAVELIRKTLRV